MYTIACTYNVNIKFAIATSDVGVIEGNGFSRSTCIDLLDTVGMCASNAHPAICYCIKNVRLYYIYMYINIAIIRKVRVREGGGEGDRVPRNYLN